MATPPAMSAEQIAEAALLYTEHEWPVPDIAEHFDVGVTTVRRKLLEAGVELRPTGPAPVLRIKQCTKCLQFLPVGMFSWCGSGDNRRLQSHCTDCTNHRDKTPEWNTNPAPLTAAVNTWSRLQ